MINNQNHIKKKSIKKMMQNPNIWLNKKIESHKDKQKLMKSPNMFPNKKIHKIKEEHKNQKVTI